MNTDSVFGLYGAPVPGLVEIPRGAVQLSPLIPGAGALEDIAPGALSGLTMLAPPGTLERGHAIALGLRALRPAAPLTVLAPKTKGGSRIVRDLESFGCEVRPVSRRHHRIVTTSRPQVFAAEAEALIAAAVLDGAARYLPELGLWSQPGVFSWDRIDPGTAALLEVLPAFIGRGADLGCGIGVIARAVLAGCGVTQLHLVDLDRRAIEAARRNIDDARTAFHWSDVRAAPHLENLDFVVMNPPFHDGGLEDRALGEAFVRKSHQALRPGGTAWLVANVHLAYEAVLSETFARAVRRAERGGYKVIEAVK